MADKTDYTRLEQRIKDLEKSEIEFRRSERTLQENERRFREILEDVEGISIQGYDENRRVTFWNPASEIIYGYTEKEALGKKLEDLIIPETMREQVIHLHERWINHGEKIPAGELILRDKQGNDIPVFSSHTLIHTHKGKEMFCIDVDLKPIKQAEKALEESRGLFELITGHTSALVSIHDAAGNYLFASSSHTAMGYDPEELIGRPGFTMIENEDVKFLAKHLEKARKGELSRAFLTYRLRDKQGNIHFFRGSFDGVFKEDGRVERIICVGEDITELHQAQVEKMEALTLAAESKKLALVGQIAGRMAHDFNNILGVIMGNTELALMDCPHEQTVKTLELIAEQTFRGRNLTKNLVAFARDQEPKQEFFSINKKIDLILTLLKKDLEGIVITREYGENLPELLADAGMIEHALINLIQNSIHATSLSLRPEIIVRTSRHQESLFIEIEDNGCGIPGEFLESIFDPAFTLKGTRDTRKNYRSDIRGSGYGMANVKKYIRQNQGDVAVWSKPGQGTRITLTLPVIKKQLTPHEIKELAACHIHTGKKILVVEDEKAIQDIQHRVLTTLPCGHGVDIAANGKAAMDLLKENSYELVSLDYILPGEINGMDIYRHIRKTDKTLPVLFISGNIEFLETIQTLKQNDPHMDHLSKPCRNKDYVARINQLLSGVG